MWSAFRDSDVRAVEIALAKPKSSVEQSLFILRECPPSFSSMPSGAVQGRKATWPRSLPPNALQLIQPKLLRKEAKLLRHQPPSAHQ